MSEITQTKKGDDLTVSSLFDLGGTSEIDEMLAIQEQERAGKEAQKKADRQRELLKKFQEEAEQTRRLNQERYTTLAEIEQRLADRTGGETY